MSNAGSKQFNVAIIGAGIIGSSLALLLSEYSGRILLIDKAVDVSRGATGANSGIVHGGYTAKAGTLKGGLSIRGNRMYSELSQRLGFPFRKIGSHTLAFSEEDEAKLEALRENGLRNGVRGLEILPTRKVLEREGRINPQVRSALYCPETGIVSPYEACIAIAEQAVNRGVRLCLGTEVRAIRKGAADVGDGAAGGSASGGGEQFSIETNRGNFRASAVVNAAGAFADRISAMLGLHSFSIVPRKGEYIILRRGSAEGIHSVIFQTPSAQGKGVLVTPTCWTNLMIGPNAEVINERVDRSTSLTTLRRVFDTARRSIPDLKAQHAIRIFAGVRPSSDRGDFIIEESAVPGFINVAGIDSPGLTAAPAIAERALGILQDGGYVSEQKRSGGGARSRRAIQSFYSLEAFKAIRSDIDREMGDPDRIVCRCEQVRERTIRDALSRGIPIQSMDGIKFRTRAGMGACQGEFCGERVRRYVEEHNGGSVSPAHHPPKESLAQVRTFGSD